MTMHRLHRTLRWTCLPVVAAALMMPGCNSTKQHDEWVADANDRWHSLRSHVMLETATNQFNAGQLKQAEKTVTDAASVDADNPALYTLAGRIALEKGELEYAFKLFARAIVLEDLEPAPSAEPYYFQGVVLQRWQKHEEALERYQAAHRLEPDNASRLLAVAETLVTLERFDEAIKELESRLTYFDSNAAIRVALGHIYGLKGNPKKAADYYRDAALLAPDETIIREELARTLIEADQPEQAVRVLEDLLADDAYAHRTDLMRRLAAAQLKSGRVADARQTYIDITNIEFDVATDWIKLGELSWRMDDMGGSLIAANKVMELAPNRHEGYLMAGMVWQKRDRLEDALRLFDHAARLAPNDNTPLLMRGLALQKAGKIEAASLAYRSALKRDPQDARAQKLLASAQSAVDAQASVPTEPGS